MPKTEPFDKDPSEYDRWYDRHRAAFSSELEAIKRLMPDKGPYMEVGVGTGRFAEALGINIGVDPSPKMRELARKRGIDAIDGVAESLPFMVNWFNCVLMTTVIEFVDDVRAAFGEAFRVLKPGGCIIVGFIDKNGPLGAEYESKKETSAFMKDARFYSVDEVIGFLTGAGFKDFTFTQTLFKGLQELKETEPVKDGYGEGSFVVVRAKKEALKNETDRGSGYFF